MLCRTLFGIYLRMPVRYRLAEWWRLATVLPPDPEGHLWFTWHLSASRWGIRGPWMVFGRYPRLSTHIGTGHTGVA